MSVADPLPPPVTFPLPQGTSTLPIVELDRRAIETDRTRIRFRRGSQKRASADCSFGNFAGTLGFSAWSFFHAAKKTELTSSFNTASVDHRASGFAAEYDGLFVWNTRNFRRVDRSVFALEDFAESSLAGRCGEAIAYLTMVKWGYVFWDRIAVLWERAANQSGMTHPEMVHVAQVVSSRLATRRPDLEPDFAFEKPSRDVALMEAKGSFVHPIYDNPSTKDDLRHGLRQLAAWSDMIAPPPHKSFAIGTYLRDSSDAAGDPSLIAFVDPPAEVSQARSPLEFPSDLIRRGNYGAWLVGMGFSASGNALRNCTGIQPNERQLTVLTLGRRQFAVTFQGVVLKPHGPRRFPFPMPWMEYLMLAEGFPHHPAMAVEMLRQFGIAAVQVMGIEVNTLQSIQAALADPTSEALMEIEATDVLLEQPAIAGFSGSIMPDNTLFGQIGLDALANGQLKVFRL